MNGGVVKIRSWEEFKRLAVKLKPNAVIYNIEESVPARELTGLRLILPGRGMQYVFLDFPKGNKLRETGIPLHKDEKGNRYIDDEDVVNYVRTQLKREDLAVYSYWTI